MEKTKAMRILLSILLSIIVWLLILLLLYALVTYENSLLILMWLLLFAVTAEMIYETLEKTEKDKRR